MVKRDRCSQGTLEIRSRRQPEEAIEVTDFGIGGLDSNP
jgi:hypothetical protein